MKKLLLLFGILLLLGITSFVILYLKRNAANQPEQSHIVKIVYIVPKPDLKTYTNTTYQYQITYPAQLKIDETNYDYDHSNVLWIFPLTNIWVPDAVAVKVTCYANPSQLDALGFWNTIHPYAQDESSHYSHYDEQKIGWQQLRSGLQAYVAIFRGQATVKSYTVTSGERACEIEGATGIKGYDSFIDSMVNSFTWIN